MKTPPLPAIMKEASWLATVSPCMQPAFKFELPDHVLCLLFQVETFWEEVAGPGVPSKISMKAESWGLRKLTSYTLRNIKRNHVPRVSWPVLHHAVQPNPMSYPISSDPRTRVPGSSLMSSIRHGSLMQQVAKAGSRQRRRTIQKWILRLPWHLKTTIKMTWWTIWRRHAATQTRSLIHNSPLASVALRTAKASRWTSLTWKRYRKTWMWRLLLQPVDLFRIPRRWKPWSWTQRHLQRPIARNLDSPRSLMR